MWRRVRLEKTTGTLNMVATIFGSHVFSRQKKTLVDVRASGFFGIIIDQSVCGSGSP